MAARSDESAHASSQPRASRRWLRTKQILGAPIPLFDGVTWRSIAYLVAAAAAFTLIDLHWWLLLNDAPSSDLHGTLQELWPVWFVGRLSSVASQVLALVVAFNLRRRAQMRAAEIALALLIGSFIGAICYTPFEATLSQSLLAVSTSALQDFAFGGAFVFAFFAYRHDAAVARALQKAEINRIVLRRRALESDLQVMQARVEPPFLFNTLRRIGDLHHREPAVAEGMLEDLTVYLRAALPELRSTRSTLGREMRLAQSFLNIERAQHGRLRLTFDVPPELDAAPFPPMLLLPLIERLKANDTLAESQSASLDIVASGTRDEIDIKIVSTGAMSTAATDFDDLRSRLMSLCADRAALIVENRSANETVALLQLRDAQPA